MIYLIFENGAEINRIVADEDFCRDYCAENGYTYELEPEPAPAPPEPPLEERNRADIDFFSAMTGIKL